MRREQVSNHHNHDLTGLAGSGVLKTDPGELDGSSGFLRRQPLSEWLVQNLGDAGDLAESSCHTTPEDDSHDRVRLLWAMKKPAMDLGLIPHEPRPKRSCVEDTADTRADAMCKAEPSLVRPYIAAREYGISPSVLRGWYSYHKIGAVCVCVGDAAVFLYRRAEIERALKQWKPGRVTQNDFQDDEGLPQRIARAAVEFRTDASLLGDRVAHDGPVAADSQGRSRPFEHGRGSHGCGPDSLAPRDGKERHARGFTNTEVVDGDTTL